MVQMRAGRGSTPAKRGSKLVGRGKPSWIMLRAGLEGLGVGWEGPYTSWEGLRARLKGQLRDLLKRRKMKKDNLYSKNTGKTPLLLLG